MTDPQPDEATVARTEAKALVKEAMEEWRTELLAKEEEEAPKRTEKPTNTIFKSLFGG